LFASLAIFLVCRLALLASWSCQFLISSPLYPKIKATVTRTPRTMDLLESSSDEDEISPLKGRADHGDSTTGLVNDAALSLLVQYAKSSKEGVLRAICDKW
jgi:hypothetical protein